MQMIKITTSITALVLVAACATPSAQHTAQSANHSAQAASHGSAAVASGAATVSAVPILATGAVLSVTGAAIESVGTTSVAVGAEVLEASLGGPVQGCQPLQTAATCPAPDGPPRLN